MPVSTMNSPSKSREKVRRTLYSPRLADDLVRALYHRARDLGQPMTCTLDDIVRAALAGNDSSSCSVRESATDDVGAA